MKQLITTTELQNVYSLFNDFNENINKYKQLQKIFEKNKEYLVFAEPQLSKNNDKISWFTEFEGKIVPFPKLSEDDKSFVLEKLKKQVNQLYLSILEMIDDDEQIKKFFNLIDNCLEIPDYFDIFVVEHPSGEKNFCLTRWAFALDESKTKKNILSSIIPIKVNTLTVRVIKGNNIPATNQEVFVKFVNEEKEQQFITNEDGIFILQDAPLLEDFEIFIKDSQGNQLFKRKYKVLANQEISFFIETKNIEKQKVKIKVVDKANKPLPNTTIKVKYENFEKEYETNENGEVFIGELYLNTEFKVLQISEDKIISQESFTVKKDKTLYVVNAYRTKDYGTLKISVENQNGKPISNAQIQIIYDNNSFVETSDANGLVIFKNIPFKKEIKIRQLINGIPQYQKTIKFVSESQTYVFQGSEIDDLDFINVEVNVKDSKNNPVPNLRILLSGNQRDYGKITNEKGFARFENVFCKQDLKLIVEYKRKRVEKEIKCTQKEQKHNVVLEDNNNLLMILGVIAAIILLISLIFIIPKSEIFHSKQNKNIATDTITKDTLKQEIFDGFSLKIEKNGNPVENLNVSVKTSDTIFSGKTDNKGLFRIEQLKDYKGFVTISINRDPKQTYQIKFDKNITLNLKPYSIFVKESLSKCDTLIFSNGYQQTFRTFKLNNSKGIVKIYTHMYSNPDKIIVYKGGIKDTLKSNELLNSNFRVQEKFFKFPYESRDSLITVRIISQDSSKIKWAYIVYSQPYIKKTQ